MHELPMDLPRRHEILRALERMMDVMDPDDVAGTAAAGRKALAGVLARPAYASAHQLVATGHAHIDSAWLWPVRETIRKCARTFSNVLALMDEQPRLRLLLLLGPAVRLDQGVLPGAVRPDPGEGGQPGSSFRSAGCGWSRTPTCPAARRWPGSSWRARASSWQEFGVDCQEVWLPDSFGYSAALPQIVAAAGIRWFLTQKISWNQVNRMPHHTFRWEGIDGTRVFTHFPPVDTYNSELQRRGTGPRGAQLPRAWPRHHLAGAVRLRRRRRRPDPGDARRRRGARRTWKARRRCRIGSRRRVLRAGRRPSTPIRRSGWGRCTWNCTAAPTPARPGPSRATGAASTCCGRPSCGRPPRPSGCGCAYPLRELERLWRLVLLQQFHDILPGSSIAWVHQDAERNYAAIAAELEALISGAAAGARRARGPGVPAANAAPHERPGVPALAAAGLSRRRRRRSGSSRGRRRLRPGQRHHPGGDRRQRAADLADGLRHRPRGDRPGGVGNLLELHRDTPNEWDAWDIDEFYRHNVTSCGDGAVGDARTERLGRPSSWWNGWWDPHR